MTHFRRLAVSLGLVLCTAAQAATDTARYNFEAGTQGWVIAGDSITSLSAVTGRAFAGTRSLAVQFAAGSAVGQQQVVISNPGVTAGKVVTFHIYLPAGVPLNSLQVFMQESEATGWRWTATWKPLSALKT